MVQSGRTVRAMALCARAGAEMRRGRPLNGIVRLHDEPFPAH